MTWRTETIAGLRVLVVAPERAVPLSVVMLHGYAMRPEDLAPFTTSLGVPAAYYLPEGPLQAEVEGRAWWPIDQERRARAMAVGPRDLAEEHPAGVAAARAQLRRLLQEVERRDAGRALVLVGFSQGGMLACDLVLRERPPIAGLALLSASRIAVDDWTPLAGALAGLPVLVSHGRHDPDLGFHAGERLRDMCRKAGAEVTWVPFEGAHGIPLVVWRALRRFLSLVS